ncbi:ScbR family autoregulator-binding transcription factor [Streptomyces sp. NPDC086023]|uniref:ScbR family autoregulator-binding transcription factor n=1 Tax=Streptomyces sp. NPDC086023 TaxID=3365746 RepID=UPI0037D7C64B
MTTNRMSNRTSGRASGRTPVRGGNAVQERSERTRRRLVNAGAEMFRRNGYANATLGEIALAAGVTKGALYFHFASKDELAEAVQQHGRTMLNDSVRSLREAGSSPLQALIDTTHWLARTLHEEPAISASFRITKECTGRQPHLADFHRAWIAMVCTLLRQARDAGELRPDLGWESAESLVAAAACGIEVMSGTGMVYAELRRRVSALWTLLLPLLVAPGNARHLRVEAPDEWEGPGTAVAPGVPVGTGGNAG